MPHAEEVRPPLREPAGDYDAQMEFRRDIETSRIAAEQRAQLQAMTRDILRQNAGRDLSPVFAEPAPALEPVAEGCAAIDDYLAVLGYTAPIGGVASTLPREERAAARTSHQAHRAASGRAA